MLGMDGIPVRGARLNAAAMVAATGKTGPLWTKYVLFEKISTSLHIVSGNGKAILTQIVSAHGGVDDFAFCVDAAKLTGIPANIAVPIRGNTKDGFKLDDIDTETVHDACFPVIGYKQAFPEQKSKKKTVPLISAATATTLLKAMNALGIDDAPMLATEKGIFISAPLQNAFGMIIGTYDADEISFPGDSWK